MASNKRPSRACPGCLAARSAHTHALVYLEPHNQLCPKHGYRLATPAHAERPFHLLRLPVVAIAHHQHLQFRRRHRDTANAAVSQARALINKQHARNGYLRERWNERASRLAITPATLVASAVTYPEVILLAKFIATRQPDRPLREDFGADFDEIGRRLGGSYPPRPTIGYPIMRWLRQEHDKWVERNAVRPASR